MPHQETTAIDWRERRMARVTGLEPATSGVTGRHSNRLSYTRASCGLSAPARFVRSFEWRE
nr:hypothetical protein SHINE37_40998 [Rhizobiaceae bacterium]